MEHNQTEKKMTFLPFLFFTKGQGLVRGRMWTTLEMMCFFYLRGDDSFPRFSFRLVSFAPLHQKSICFMSEALAALPPHSSDDELTLHCGFCISEFPWRACLAAELCTCFSWQNFFKAQSLWIKHTGVSSSRMENGAERAMLPERCELWRKWLADHQSWVLPLQGAELLLGSTCLSKDCIFQHPMQIAGVMRFVFANWMWVEVMCISSNTKWARSKCAFFTLFFTISQ